MQNSLGLDDDLDGVEVLQELERVFDIQVTNEEATQILTVGDFFDLLIKKISPNTADQKCAGAMAYYRLRHALRVLGYGPALYPSTDISFLEGGNVKAKLKEIERVSGLNLPHGTATAYGCIGALIAFLAMPFAGYLLYPNAVSVVFGSLVGVFAGGAVLNYIDPGHLPRQCSTLADLARKTATLSFGHLTKAGARHSDSDIWEHLVETLSSYQLAKSEITRETFFLKSQLKKVQAA